MEEIPAKEMLLTVETSNYFSHHCVFKDSIATIKFRVVFDGSANTTSGISLNDRLMVGPKLQKHLIGIFIRFRFHPVALSADIATMYRQVELDAEDKDYHRIHWREPNSQDVKTYRMTRNLWHSIISLSFNSTITSFSRSWWQKNAANNFSDMYFDDLLTAAADILRALQLQGKVILILWQARFNVRKWTSSNAELVERLSANYQETADEVTIKSENYSIKTLGVKWSQNQDHFSFLAKFDEKKPSTQREILSEVTRLFDPSGWVSYATVQFKSFEQLLWVDRLGWDKVVSSSAACSDLNSRKIIHYPEKFYQLHQHYLTWNFTCFATHQQQPTPQLLFTPKSKRLRSNKDADSKDKSCPNKELVFTPIRAMRISSWR